MFAEYKRRRRLSLRPVQTSGLVKQFAMCKLGDMKAHLTIEALRRELGLNQAEFARRIGLANKASVSLLERGGPCSLPVALAIEALSEGRINAADLNEDVRAARHGVVTTSHGPALSPGKSGQNSRAFDASEAA